MFPTSSVSMWGDLSENHLNGDKNTLQLGRRDGPPYHGQLPTSLRESKELGCRMSITHSEGCVSILETAVG